MADFDASKFREPWPDPDVWKITGMGHRDCYFQKRQDPSVGEWWGLPPPEKMHLYESRSTDKDIMDKNPDKFQEYLQFLNRVGLVIVLLGIGLIGWAVYSVIY